MVAGHIGYSYKYGKTQVDQTQFKDEEALISKASDEWTQAAEKHAFDRMMGSYVSGGDLIHDDTPTWFNDPNFFDTHPDDLGKKSLATSKNYGVANRRDAQASSQS